MKSKARQQVVTRSYANRDPDYRLGLTKADVAERISQGDVNTSAPSLTRSNLRIVKDNVFTLFNILAVVLTGLMVSIGEFKNALFIGVAVSNTALGIFQEIRAKRIIDKLSIITQSEATVVREGVQTAIAPEEIVLDDILYLSAGNQICSDGVVVESEGLEINESLLTGESDVIQKPQGAQVFSGSFVASGSGYIKVTNVGEENYANRISANSRYEKKPESQLMRFLNRIITVLTFIVMPLGILLFTIRYFNGSPYADAILGATASMVSIIPEGLMLLTGLSLAIGVLNLAKCNTLAQSVPSIETLARVNVLCLDKTGTITSGDMKVHSLIPTGHLPPEELETALSEVARTMNEPSATNRAIRERYFKTSQWEVTGETPFSSARKWSSVTFKDQGTYVIGAPELVCPHLPEEIQQSLVSSTRQGYRVLLLAHTRSTLEDRKLPDDLECLALIVLADTIRQEAKETFAFFKEEGVAIKVISGDHPVTVSKVAAEAGIEGAGQWVDMSAVPEQAITQELVENTVVFGRVTPYQKVALIRAMKESGKITAMTGDGVNDVMALREADCGVAMASGSDAARSAADFVLMDSNFASMVNVVQEGRRVVNNMEAGCLSVPGEKHLRRHSIGVVHPLEHRLSFRTDPIDPHQLRDCRVSNLHLNAEAEL